MYGAVAHFLSVHWKKDLNVTIHVPFSRQYYPPLSVFQSQHLLIEVLIFLYI